jgi:hypothetical protein
VHAPKIEHLRARGVRLAAVGFVAGEAYDLGGIGNLGRRLDPTNFVHVIPSHPAPLVRVIFDGRVGFEVEPRAVVIGVVIPEGQAQPVLERDALPLQVADRPWKRKFKSSGAGLVEICPDARQCPLSLYGERNSSRPTQRLPKPRQHHETRIDPNPRALVVSAAERGARGGSALG